MPLPVYSARIFRAIAFAGGPEVFFTAPEGFVTVVKDITITTGSAAVSQSAWVEDDEGGKLAWHYVSGTLTTDPLTTKFYGEWVMLAGETLAAATGTETTADFYVSGFLLTST